MVERGWARLELETGVDRHRVALDLEFQDERAELDQFLGAGQQRRLLAEEVAQLHEMPGVGSPGVDAGQVPVRRALPVAEAVVAD